ncbi:NAD(+) synthase [Flavobacterium sp. HSC-61S13]|uniref:NAD(+) synthase n=1 Tax=Flavobacterium sp. HSC-61S13 TaxID=2910963 RepID=UPI00209FC222|nr:NAD(+) synthase [Flavobacterium sp. HSC-61S13]MCP1994967.1 NAD+ synthase [Flavobacterium sp. HSC-61S13]
MKTPIFNAKAVTEHIVLWLKNYAEEAGVKGFVIGISGGIDSAVTSTLCAMTGLPTLCIEMPIHQAPSQVSRGQEQLNFLKNNFKNTHTALADLTETFDLFQKAVPQENASTETLRLTLANTRARLRMTTLYYFAGINHSLVVGTGNKIEDFGVGFFTKYGDGGVDLSPIADLLKSEVRALGVHLNVPSSIVQAKPTDGLFGDDRSDEDQLGANYDELEKAMYNKDQGLTSSDLTGRDKEVFDIYERLNRINQHKINPIPVCIIPEKLKK